MSIKVEIASVPDRDDLIAEIWNDDEMVAEIRHAQRERFILEIYPPSDKSTLVLDLDSLIQVMEEAKQRLGVSQKD